jgi:opacity protein-like surface antigen
MTSPKRLIVVCTPPASRSRRTLLCVLGVVQVFAFVLCAAPASAQDDARVYVGATAGYDWSRSTTVRDRSCDPSPQFGLFGCGNGADGRQTGVRGDFGSGAAWEATIGTRVLKTVRVEAALATRSGLALRGNANFAGAGDVQPVAADVTQRGLMARGLWAFFAKGRMTTFVSAGVGVSYARIGEVLYSFPGLPSVPSTTQTVGGTNWQRAWDLSAGASLRLRDRTRLDVTYRFSDLGTVATADGPIEVVRGDRVRTIDGVAGSRARLSSRGLYAGIRQSIF